MRATLHHRSGDQGLALPLVALLVCLLFFAVMMVGYFGSNTRILMKGQDVRRHLEDIADSALAEAVAILEAEESAKVEAGDSSWFDPIVPPFAADLPEALHLDLPLTRQAMGGQDFEVARAEVLCLHRGVNRGMAQGLLSLTVEVRTRSAIPSRRRALTRRVLLRCLVVGANDGAAFKVVVVQNPLASREVRS